jgi:hypothetical protein
MAGLEEKLMELPTAKTADLNKMELHISSLLGILNKVLSLNLWKRVRELRFRQYARRQKVLHDIAETVVTGDFQDDERDVVIAYGNATFTTRERMPGPVKTIRRILQKRKENIHFINENYTSQLCSGCHQKLDRMYDDDGESIWAVKCCNNSKCKRTVWNRDVNACINIMYIFLSEVIQGIRPEIFTRQFQLRKKQITGS